MVREKKYSIVWFVLAYRVQMQQLANQESKIASNKRKTMDGKENQKKKTYREENIIIILCHPDAFHNGAQVKE